MLYLMREMTPEQLETLVYKQSGMLGISGISGDMRKLLASDDTRAAEALEYFVYRVICEIGSLTAVLSGLDALDFYRRHRGEFGSHFADLQGAGMAGARAGFCGKHSRRQMHFPAGKVAIGMGDANG